MDLNEYEKFEELNTQDKIHHIHWMFNDSELSDNDVNNLIKYIETITKEAFEAGVSTGEDCGYLL